MCGWHGKEDAIGGNGVEGNRQANPHPQSAWALAAFDRGPWRVVNRVS